MNALSGEMTHEITKPDGLVPTEFYRQLRVDWGYRDSAPQLEVQLEKDGLAYRLLGIDPLASRLQRREGGDFDLSAAQLTRPVERAGNRGSTPLAGAGSR
ncbi:MAG: hypothetical protein R3E95_18845 [Thiolinea sp.]